MNKVISRVCRNGFSRSIAPVAIGVAAFGAAGANAASFIPASVTTGLADLQADVSSIGGLIILVILAFAAFKVIKRATSSA